MWCYNRVVTGGEAPPQSQTDEDHKRPDREKNHGNPDFMEPRE